MDYGLKIEYHIQKIKEAVGPEKFKEIKFDIHQLFEEPGGYAKYWVQRRKVIVDKELG